MCLFFFFLPSQDKDISPGKIYQSCRSVCMGNPGKSAQCSYIIERNQIRMKASFLFKPSKGVSLFSRKKKKLNQELDFINGVQLFKQNSLKFKNQTNIASICQWIMGHLLTPIAVPTLPRVTLSLPSASALPDIADKS